MKIGTRGKWNHNGGAAKSSMAQARVGQLVGSAGAAPVQLAAGRACAQSGLHIGVTNAPCFRASASCCCSRVKLNKTPSNYSYSYMHLMQQHKQAPSAFNKQTHLHHSRGLAWRQILGHTNSRSPNPSGKPATPAPDVIWASELILARLTPEWRPPKVQLKRWLQNSISVAFTFWVLLCPCCCCICTGTASRPLISRSRFSSSLSPPYTLHCNASYPKDRRGGRWPGRLPGRAVRRPTGS